MDNKDQIGISEGDAIVEGAAAEAVGSVEAEESNKAVKESSEAATTIEKEVLEPLPAGDEDESVTATEGNKSGRKSEEEASLEDIMAEEKPKTDIEKSKEGTPDAIQKRFDVITKKNKEALEAKDKEIADLKAKVIPEKRPPVPIESDFPDREEFNKAYQEWKDQDDEWKSNKDRVEKQSRAAKERFNANIGKYEASMKRMQEKYDDFDALVNNEETAVNFSHLAPVIRSTDFGPEIGYHLAKNPEKLASILELDDVSAILAIGEMSGRCKASDAKSITTAPKALKTVKDTLGGESGDGISTSEIDKISKNYLNVA